MLSTMLDSCERAKPVTHQAGKAKRIKGRSMNKARDYMAALEAVSELIEDEEQDESPEEQSEAERAAEASKAPNLRGDGQPIGAEGLRRVRQLSASQVAFARGVIEGKTLRQAYRDAYPNAQAQDDSISAAAYRLSRDPRISRMILEADEETQEHLADNVDAAKRYVIKSLVTLSKSGKQEGTKLKALELLGRSAGMFKDAQPVAKQISTAAELKAQLAGHLKLVMAGAASVDQQAGPEEGQQIGDA